MNSELLQKLSTLAFQKTIPFCYVCYTEAPTGCCKQCGSDDLMRLMPGVGCEYGTDWVVREILSQELTPIDIEETFEEFARECYPETTKVGWMELDTISVMKSMDPIWWQCAVREHESNEEAEGLIISFDSGSTYYLTADLEELTSK